MQNSTQESVGSRIIAIVLGELGNLSMLPGPSGTVGSITGVR